MQPTYKKSFEIKAICLDEILVDYELVMVSFIAYSMLPAEKYDDKAEIFV